ncbi:MAG: glycosyltransferase family 39 protein [Betaproteobacteria bacterium]|nr:glycosyltransferase family 39 protein [Betaproteobacteria bacterium]MDE2057064.1 glycosyltransferase family 39 protein [Betaproteobacteria bacterium]
MRSFVVLLLLGITIWGAGLSSRSLMRPDEGRYAEIAREMAINHDWISPRLNNILYFEKPPLQYWATATAINSFGVNNFSARLWTALCGLLGIVITAFTAFRLWGKLAALASSAVLGSSLYYVALGHINTLDMGVSFFITVAIDCFLLALHENQKRYMWLAWLAAALAFLSKGLIGLVLPGAALVVTTVITWRFQVWKKIQLIPGLFLFSLVALPWLIAIQLAHPTFLHFFFIHEHLDRFTTTIHRRVEPFWYFIPILLIGFLPWTGLLFNSMKQALCAPFKSYFSAERFLALFIIIVMVFFSISDSKLPSYILPIFPALALITGRYLSQDNRLTLSVSMTGLIWGTFLVFAGLILHFPQWGDQLGIHPDLDPDMVIPYQNLGFDLCFAGLVWGLFFILHRLTQHYTSQLVMIGFTGLISTQIMLIGSQALSPIASMDGIAQKLHTQLSQASHIYSVGTYDQTLDYYLQRTVTLVDFEDELAMGLELEPQQSISSIKSFASIWDKDLHAVALMQPSTYQELQHKGLVMRVIYKDFRHVIVARI